MLKLTYGYVEYHTFSGGRYPQRGGTKPPKLYWLKPPLQLVSILALSLVNLSAFFRLTFHCLACKKKLFIDRNE